MIRLLSILAALLALTCFVFWLENDNLIESNKKLSDDIRVYQSTITSKEAAIEGLKKDVALKESLVIKQQQKTYTLQSQLKETKGKLNELSTTDKAVKDWVDQPVPASVIRLLKQASSANKD